MVSANKLITIIKEIKGFKIPRIVWFIKVSMEKFKHIPKAIKVISIKAKDSSKEIV